MTDKPVKIRGHLKPGRPISSLDSAELEHLFSCPFCQTQLTEYVEKEELVMAPAHLKAEILSRCRQTSQKPAVRSAVPEVSRPVPRPLTKRMELFFYSLRVGAAVACSLILLAFMPALSGRADRMAEAADKFPAPYIRHDIRITEPLKERVSDFTEQLNRLMNLEVFRYDKKEK